MSWIRCGCRGYATRPPPLPPPTAAGEPPGQPLALVVQRLVEQQHDQQHDQQNAEDGQLLSMIKTVRGPTQTLHTGPAHDPHLSEHWADVRFPLLRQMVDVGRVNGKSVLMVVFERVTNVLRVHGPGPPPKSIKDLLRQTRQAERHIPVTRRRYLENNNTGSTQRHRQQLQENVSAARARQTAAEYKRSEEEAWQALQRPTNLSDVYNLVDERIREARAAGDFENIPGRFKPINFDDRPQHIDSTTFIMNRIIKKQGGTLDWVDRSRSIDDAAADFRKRLREHWNAQQRTSGRQWDTVVEEKMAVDLAEINRLVRNFNLSVPVARMQRWGYTIEQELRDLYDAMPEGSWQPLVHDEHAMSQPTTKAAPADLAKISKPLSLWRRVWLRLSTPIS